MLTVQQAIDLIIQDDPSVEVKSVSESSICWIISLGYPGINESPPGTSAYVLDKRTNEVVRLIPGWGKFDEYMDSGLKKIPF